MAQPEPQPYVPASSAMREMTLKAVGLGALVPEGVGAVEDLDDTLLV